MSKAILFISSLLCCVAMQTTRSHAQGTEHSYTENEYRDSVRAKYYNRNAAVNAPVEAAVNERGDVVRDTAGSIVYKAVAKDTYGNAQGNQYDLAADGAFKGETILVLHMYTGEGFNFELPKKALEEKGFSIYRYINNPPSPEQLKKDLEKACQLWVISDMSSKLNDGHLEVIKAYFDSGHGVYIWGDNQPYYEDANKVAQHLFGGSMAGNTMGDQPIGIQFNERSPGIREGHDITTGLETVYEGITIATIADHSDLTPILYGSAGNLVSAAYEKDGKRAILDGGFTRLFLKWETAGTDRFVKNAAAWLVNVENLDEYYVDSGDK